MRARPFPSSPQFCSVRGGSVVMTDMQMFETDVAAYATPTYLFIRTVVNGNKRERKKPRRSHTFTQRRHKKVDTEQANVPDE